ncbi:MAG: hypothetical protein ACE5KG_03060 [Nitrososphaerales archaeon]
MGPTLSNEKISRDAIICAKNIEKLDQLIKDACPSDMVNLEDLTLNREQSEEIKRIDKEMQVSRSDNRKKNMLLVYKYYLKGYLSEDQLDVALIGKAPEDLFTNNTKMYPLREDLR